MRELTPEYMTELAGRIDAIKTLLILSGASKLEPGQTGLCPESELLVLGAAAQLEQASVSLSLALLRQTRAIAEQRLKKT